VLTVLALVLPTGLLIGFSLGALGGGGSMLAVPALVYLFGQDPRAATTGSLLIVGVTSAIGALAHWRAGRVRLGSGLAFGALGIAGSLAGTRLSAGVPANVLLASFSVLILVVAALMTRRRREQARTGCALTRGIETPIVSLRPSLTVDASRGTTLVLTATGVGLLTGFFGVGGGFAAVPAIVLVLGLPMPVAVGTSLLVISINSFTALAFRADAQLTLDWWVIGGFTISAVVGSLAGSRLVSRVSPARLSIAFTGLLVAVALYTAARSFPALL